MVDIETDIYDTVREAIKQVCSDCEVSSRFYTSQPTIFPAVSILEISNLPVESAIDSSDDEPASAVTYQVAVYSNLQNGGKAQCKEIISAVSTVLHRWNCQRTMCELLSNMADNTITRMTARFVVNVSKNMTMFRR